MISLRTRVYFLGLLTHHPHLWTGFNSLTFGLCVTLNVLNLYIIFSFSAPKKKKAAIPFPGYTLEPSDDYYCTIPCYDKIREAGSAMVLFFFDYDGVL